MLNFFVFLLIGVSAFAAICAVLIGILWWWTRGDRMLNQVRVALLRERLLEKERKEKEVARLIRARCERYDREAAKCRSAKKI